MIRKYFECYSSRLNEFLMENGLAPIRQFYHNTTGVLCHVYVMTDELSELLKQWGRNNPNKRG